MPIVPVPAMMVPENVWSEPSLPKVSVAVPLALVMVARRD
jgi:hypothetical protein